MLLKQETRANVNISSPQEVLSFTYTGTKDLTVLVRVILGAVTSPIAGNGVYALPTSVNGVPVVPVSDVTVPAGTSQAIVQSRYLVLAPGDVLLVQAQGLPGDVSVATTARLSDVTPAQTTDLTGAGSVVVDHDYGGVDNLIVKNRLTGSGIDGATILAFKTSDYSAGNRSAQFVMGTARTDIEGRWLQPIMLNPGAYTLVISTPGGDYSATVFSLQVN